MKWQALNWPTLRPSCSRRRLSSAGCLALLCAVCASAVLPPSDSIARGDELENAIRQSPVFPNEATSRFKEAVLHRIAPLKLAPTAAEWQEQARRIRQSVLDDVVFKGVPAGWRSPKRRIEWTAVIDQPDYRIRKLKFEAVPGLWIPAALYEPRKLTGKTPVVLNVNGHSADGKVTEYKQRRCIHQAKQGMIALNVEWIGMGQLRDSAYSHNNAGLLDLCGRAGLSVFFLNMQRGLDILLAHEHADPQRVAVTGLSGGGWQTIVLSSLDTRVTLAAPVAGHSALAQRVANYNSVGDLEQNPTDLASLADYVHLNALMAPRPLLLIYNTKDNCCFVASTVKANTYEPVIPFYEQAKAGSALEYYENDDPGTHNYDLDNRQRVYKFLNRHFFPGEDRTAKETPADDQILSKQQLHVDLPEENATIYTLAAAAAANLPINVKASPVEQRKHLQGILRLKSWQAKSLRAKTMKVSGKEVKLEAVEVGGEWITPIVSIAPTNSSVDELTIVVCDQGFAAVAETLAELSDTTRVVGVDPLFFGANSPQGPRAQNTMLLSVVGKRALGVQTGQLLGVVQLQDAKRVHVRALGRRASLVARLAHALDGGKRIHSVTAEDEIDSLHALIKPTVQYNQWPEAYCFGLLEHFDVKNLKLLAK